MTDFKRQLWLDIFISDGYVANDLLGTTMCSKRFAECVLADGRCAAAGQSLAAPSLRLRVKGARRVAGAAPTTPPTDAETPLPPPPATTKEPVVVVFSDASPELLLPRRGRDVVLKPPPTCGINNVKSSFVSIRFLLIPFNFSLIYLEDAN